MTNETVKFEGQGENNGLVFIDNNQTITTSKLVAYAFEKQHKHVLRDIEKLKKDMPNFGPMFMESTAWDSYGREQKIYLINKDGFLLLAMGFTGSKALKFKAAFIEAFNEMQKRLEQPKPLTAREQMNLIMEVSEETAQRVDKLEEKVQTLQTSITIDYTQQKQIQVLVNKKVLEALGGKGSPAYKELGRKVYAAAYRELKNYFFIPRYQELKKVDFDKAIDLLNRFTPGAALEIDIEELNKGGL